MIGRICLGLLVLGILPGAVSSDYLTARDKIKKLERSAFPRGARVSFTSQELNAYLRREMPRLVGPGTRNSRIEIDRDNIARGFVDVDFLKLRQAHGEAPGWLLSKLLEGERPVEITVRLHSARGHGRVDVLKVSVNGVVAEGQTLDFLIANFLLPTFPYAAIGKDFPMEYNLDRLELRPGGVTVVLRK